MNRFQKYIQRVSMVLLLILIGIIILFKFHFLSKSFFLCIITAKLLTGLHFITGMYLNEKGLREDDRKFLIYVLGGMVTRLFLLFGLIIFSIQILKLNFNYFILSIFIFYIFFMILEVSYLMKYDFKSTRIK